MINIERNETKLKVSGEAYKLYFEGIGFKKIGVEAKKAEKNVDLEKSIKGSKNENSKEVGDK